MGGKTWSRLEEKCFWRTIIPQSPKAVNEANRAKDWQELAELMQEQMGDKPRRKYTRLMLCEGSEVFGTR